MRRSLLLALISAVFVACAEDPAPTPPAGGPEPSADPIVEARLDIYESLARELVEAEEIEWNEIAILKKLCRTAGAPTVTESCEDSLSPTEQADLAARLDDLGPPITFVDDPTPLYDEEWFSGGPDVIVLRLGSIAQTGERVEVDGSYLCGGLCGSGTTYVLEEIDDGWAVVGTIGTAWIA